MTRVEGMVGKEDPPAHSPRLLSGSGRATWGHFC